MNELLKIVYLLIVWVHLGRSVYQQVDVDDVRYSADEDQDQNSEVNIFQEFVVPEVELEVPCEFSFDGGRVCDCNFSSKDMVLPIMSGNLNQIQIMNCKTLYVRKNTFINLFMLRIVRFRYIENLILEPKSLAFQRTSNKLRLEFDNMSIEEFPSHTISGNIEVLTFNICKLGVIHAFFISGLAQEMFALEFQSSSINQIHPQAFKKLIINKFTFVDVKFVAPVPSRAFYDIEINDLLSLRNCSLSDIRPGAFQFTGVHNFQLLNNQLESLNGNCLQLTIKEAINIQANTMKKISGLAFQSITLDSDYFSRHSEALEFNFNSNSIEIVGQPYRLEFAPRFRIHINKLNFIQPITCHAVDLLKSNEFFREHGESIYFQLSDVSENIDNEKYNSFLVISQQMCIPKSYLLYIVIGVLALILVLVVLLTLVIVLYIRKRRAAQLMSVVQPEGRTYRETQIVMQIENAGLLKTDL